TSRPHPAPPRAAPPDHQPTFAQVSTAVDESGDLPESLVNNKPLNGRRLEPPNTSGHRWPLFRIPEHGPERTEATRRVLHRLGLQPGGRRPVPLWRARALLCWWWQAGGSPAGLLWALDHHPDRPEHHRGDAFRGARDPLRVLGHRLAPWRGRLRELPAAVTGIRGDYPSMARGALDRHLSGLRDRGASSGSSPAGAPPTLNPYNPYNDGGCFRRKHPRDHR
ncbi:MAG: hypothetical protein L0I76_34570, partial [Pseudonocardia sp.]|nr:hypothetical protein [Pseudonocardia sp.]